MLNRGKSISFGTVYEYTVKKHLYFIDQFCRSVFDWMKFILPALEVLKSRIGTGLEQRLGPSE